MVSNRPWRFEREFLIVNDSARCLMSGATGAPLIAPFAMSGCWLSIHSVILSAAGTSRSEGPREVEGPLRSFPRPGAFVLLLWPAWKTVKSENPMPSTSHCVKSNLHTSPCLLETVISVTPTVRRTVPPDLTTEHIVLSALSS